MSENGDDLDIPATDDTPGPDSAVDEASFRKKHNRKNLLNAMREDFWAGLLTTEIGRREVFAQLVSFGTFEERFGHANGFPQAEASYFCAGKREAGLLLYWNLMRHSPEHIVLMHQENDARFKKAD